MKNYEMIMKTLKDSKALDRVEEIKKIETVRTETINMIANMRRGRAAAN